MGENLIPGHVYYDKDDEKSGFQLVFVSRNESTLYFKNYFQDKPCKYEEESNGLIPFSRNFSNDWYEK